VKAGRQPVGGRGGRQRRTAQLPCYRPQSSVRPSRRRLDERSADQVRRVEPKSYSIAQQTGVISGRSTLSGANSVHLLLARYAHRYNRRRAQGRGQAVGAEFPVAARTVGAFEKRVVREGAVLAYSKATCVLLSVRRSTDRSVRPYCHRHRTDPYQPASALPAHARDFSRLRAAKLNMASYEEPLVFAHRRAAGLHERSDLAVSHLPQHGGRLANPASRGALPMPAVRLRASTLAARVLFG